MLIVVDWKYWAPKCKQIICEGAICKMSLPSYYNLPKNPTFFVDTISRAYVAWGRKTWERTARNFDLLNSSPPDYHF